MAGENENSKEILDAGANSIVYKDVMDNKEVIVKMSRNNNDTWLFCASKEYKMLSMLKDKKRDLAADIPEMYIEQDGNQTKIIQTAIKGEFLTKEMYLSCSAEQQDKIAQDIAEAMFAIHNLDIREIAEVTNNGYIPEEKREKKNSDRYFRGNYQSLINNLGKHISPETKNVLDSFIKNKFDSLENVNRHVAPIHNDIRYSNIFYDKENSKVGIIDFGGCEVGDIYHDFASIGLPNSLGFELQKKVIDSYNKLLQKYGRDFQISPETAKAYSVARTVYYANMMDNSEKVRKTLFPKSSGDEIIGLEDYLREAGVIDNNNRHRDFFMEVVSEIPVTNKERDKTMRGVTLELNPEIGELEAVPVTEESNEEKKGFGAKDDILLSRENDKQPQRKFNFETGEFYYANERLQKIAELRKRLHTENNDPLAARQKLLENGLEEIGLSKDDLGKTGDSRNGEVSDKHKKTAKSQTEDAKWSILQAKQQRGR